MLNVDKVEDNIDFEVVRDSIFLYGVNILLWCFCRGPDDHAATKTLSSLFQRASIYYVKFPQSTMEKIKSGQGI